MIAKYGVKQTGHGVLLTMCNPWMTSLSMPYPPMLDLVSPVCGLVCRISTFYLPKASDYRQISVPTLGKSYL